MTEHRSSDPPHHWTLRTALAVVIPAPAYIYDPNDPNYHERYNSLVSTVKEDVQQSAASLSGMQIESPLNPEWYRVIRPHTGGMFPSLVEVITIVKDVIDVVQPFASWASIAELALRLMRNWIARNQANPGFDRNKDRLIFSLPVLISLCRKDARDRYGISKAKISYWARDRGMGTADHPTGEERYMIVLRVGQLRRRSYCYILDGRAVDYEHFVMQGRQIKPLPLPNWLLEDAEPA